MRARFYILSALLSAAVIAAGAFGTSLPHGRDEVTYPDPADDPWLSNDGVAAVCDGCHIPHGASGGELWTSPDGIEALCYACHQTGHASGAPEMMTHQSVRAQGSGTTSDCEFCVYDFRVKCTSCHQPHAHQKPYEKGDDGDNADMFLRDEIALWKMGCEDITCGTGQHHDDLDGTCLANETCQFGTCSGLEGCELNPTANETVCVCPVGGDGTCASCLVSTGVANFTEVGGVCVGVACGVSGDDCGFGECAEECTTVDPACPTYHVDSGKGNPNGWNAGDCASTIPTSLPTCTPNGPAGSGYFDISCYGPGSICQTTAHDDDYYCECPVGGAGADCKSGAGTDGCAIGFRWDGSECVNDTCGAGDAAVDKPCGYGAECNESSVCQADTCGASAYWDETLGTPACVGFDSNNNTRVLQGSCAANPCPGGALACTTVEGGKGHICECPVGTDPASADCTACVSGFTWSAVAEKCVPDCGGATEGDPCGFGGGCSGTCPTVAATCAGGEYYDDGVGGCTTNETCAVGVNCFNGGTCEKAPFDDEYVCNCPPGTTGADCAGGTGTEGQGCDASRAYVYSGGACVVDCEAAGKVDGNACGFGGQCKPGGGGSTTTQYPSAFTGGGSGNEANAYDGNLGTAANVTPNQTLTLTTVNNPGCSGATSSVVLKMQWDCAGCTFDTGGGKPSPDDYTIQYSIDGGNAWTQWVTSSSSAAGTTVETSPDVSGTLTDCSQIPGNVQFQVVFTQNKGGDAATVHIDEAWVEVTAAGGGGLACDADYISAGCDTGYTGTACDACNNTTHFDYGNRACETTDPATTCGGCGTGTCWDDGGVGVCDCPDTYTGADCSVCGEAITLGCQKSYGDGICDTGYDGAACDACAGTHVATAEGVCVTNSGSNGPLACDTNPCVGGVDGAQGTCARAADGTAMCVCNDKYDGADCNTCTAADFSYTCDKDKLAAGCAAGYQDDGFGGICNTCAPTHHKDADGVCRPDISPGGPCDSGPCQNGGTCYEVDNGGTGYICDCPGRYVGANCETTANCSVGTTCLCDPGYANGTGVCDTCASGYVQAPDGTCIADPCSPNPCKNGGSCFVGASGTAECDCIGQYYSADGTCATCDVGDAATPMGYTAPNDALGLAAGGGGGLCEVCHTKTGHFQASSHPLATPTNPIETSKDLVDQHKDNLDLPLAGSDCIGCHIHKVQDAIDQLTYNDQGGYGFVPVAGATNSWRPNNPTPQTAPTQCWQCHLRPGVNGGPSAGDVDSYRWDGIRAWIDYDEWVQYGHGATRGEADSTQPSGNQCDNPFQPPASAGDSYPRDADNSYDCASFDVEANHGCELCHDPNITHNDPNNYFRLRNYDALSRGWGEPANDVCLVCHSEGDGGYGPIDSAIDLSLTNSNVHHFGGKHTPSKCGTISAGVCDYDGVTACTDDTQCAHLSAGGRFCWDCHDPHGDMAEDGTSPNFFMMQKRPTRAHEATGNGVPVDVDNNESNGIDGLASGVSFYDADSSGLPLTMEDYREPGTVLGNGNQALCRTCHTRTTYQCPTCSGNPNLVSGAGAHPEDQPGVIITGGCVSQCHGHDAGFGGFNANTTCVSCHAAGTDIATDDDVLSYTLNGVRAYIDIYDFGGRNADNSADSSNTGTGHGRMGSAYPGSGNAAAAFRASNGDIAGACYYCHITETGTHNSDGPNKIGNPFMLAIDCNNDGTYGDICGGNGLPVSGGDGTWNDICLRCHSDSVTNPGYDPPPDSQGNNGNPLCGAGASSPNCALQSGHARPTSTTAHTHASANANGMRCWHCHDPHGDGTNRYMIQKNAFSAIFADKCFTDSAGAKTCPDEVPSSFTAPIVFVPAGAPTAADHTNAAGPVCGQCHSTQNYCNDASCAGHNTSQACTSCHSHDGNFQGVGTCKTCHGVDSADVLDYAAGGTRGMINMIEWRDTGHGRLAASGAYDSTNGAAAFAGTGGDDGDTEAAGCYYCHLDDFDLDPDGGGPLLPHPKSSTYSWDNPFLLRGAAGNDVCLACHGAGGGGVNPAPDFQNHDAPERCNPECATTVDTAHDHGITATGSKCWHCHDPHGDGNDYMMQLNAFSNLDSGDPCTDAGGTTGCANEVPINANAGDGAAAGLTLAIGFQVSGPPTTNTPYIASGAELCGSCHQNSTSATGNCNQGNCSAAAAHSNGENCTACHGHGGDFLASGGDCKGCHMTTAQPINQTGPNPNRRAGSRRPVANDFDDGLKQSHHVRVQGGATLTSHDCVMCHAEGYSMGDCVGGFCSLSGSGCGSPSDCVTAGSKHKNQIIDLRNVDSTTAHNAANDGSLQPYLDYFPYNKDKIDQAAPPWAVGPTSNWSANNAEWVTQTSTNLDPFCLTCHDSDGAAGQAVLGELAAGANPLNPFNDDAITNITDQQDRGAVVDVASMVSTQANHNSTNFATGITQDALCIDFPVGDTNIDHSAEMVTRELRCASNTSVSCSTLGIDAANCGNYSPSEGFYSRHAIRGQSASVYTNYQHCNAQDAEGCSVDGNDTPTAPMASPGGVRSMWYATASPSNATPRMVRTGVTPSAESPQWNDSSVMSCADCHTSDGGNNTAGNAHGSNSEYLLLDRNRGATEGVNDGGTGTGPIVCYQCHDGSASYNVANAAAHAHGNTIFDADGAGTDPVLWQGLQRANAGSSGPKAVATIFGIVCTQCHGGTKWGAIHGTSEGIYYGWGRNGAADAYGIRGAYRFMNGAGMRYYAPHDLVDSKTGFDGGGNWMNLSGGIGCYTVAAADTFGGCVQHSSGTGRSPLYTRPLRY